LTESKCDCIVEMMATTMLIRLGAKRVHALRQAVPVIPRLDVLEFPDDESVLGLGELGGGNPGVLDEAESAGPALPTYPSPPRIVVPRGCRLR
jgi:hypothetical protein